MCTYTVSRKKETKIFFVISPTKLRRLWWNLVHCFLNKFATKQYKLLQLMWMMSLHCFVKLEMLIAHALPLSCYRKNSRLYPTSTVSSNFARFESSGKYCKRRCTKHAWLIWSYQRRHWRNGCRNHDMIQLGPLRFQSLFQFVPKINYAYFVHLLFQYSPRAVISWI